jgi:hypothetical protein
MSIPNNATHTKRKRGKKKKKKKKNKTLLACNSMSDISTKPMSTSPVARRRYTSPLAIFTSSHTRPPMSRKSSLSMTGDVASAVLQYALASSAQSKRKGHVQHHAHELANDVGCPAAVGLSICCTMTAESSFGWQHHEPVRMQSSVCRRTLGGDTGSPPDHPACG